MSIPDPVVLLDARARYVHPAFQMSRASTKTVWDSAGRLVTVPANALGWDHDPATGESRGYLAEPSATNLLLHSNDLTQSSWTAVNASVTGNAITGPDGQGMAKLVEDSSVSNHVLRQNFTISDGATIPISLIAKAGERSSFRAYLMQSSFVNRLARLSFDLSQGGVFDENGANGGTFVDGGIENLGGGFYHCWLVAELGDGITDARAEVRLLDGTGGTSYQGDGTSGLYLGYCQAEEGSYPTSYIETGAATATRAGDALTAAVTNFLRGGGNRGTVVLETDIEDLQEGAVLWSWGNGMVVRGYALGDDLRVSLIGTVVNSAIALTHELGRHVIAIAWDRESIRAAVNGELKPGSTLSAPGSATNMGIGCRFTGQDAWRSPIFRAVYYPARLSNADLQSLTAIQE